MRALSLADRKFLSSPSISPQVGLRKPLLLLSSPNPLTKLHMWCCINTLPSLSQPYGLQRVSTSWRDFINMTVEWAAQSMIRMDVAGYRSFVRRYSHFTRRSKRERYGAKVDHFRAVLGEPLILVFKLSWCIGSSVYHKCITCGTYATMTLELGGF